MDCLDPASPWVERGEGRLPRRRAYQCGKFMKEPVEKPEVLRNVPRTYSRYGIRERSFWRGLVFFGRPDVVLVTSMMTYWYPGPFRAIELVREAFPGVPVVLGGVYAALCHEHCMAFSGADYVFEGGGIEAAAAMVEGILDVDSRGIGRPWYPAFDLYGDLKAVAVSCSRGCPYRCAYCAASLLAGEFVQREPEEVVEEIAHWVGRYGVRDIVFYDDALLVGGESHFVPMVEEILRRKIECRFHLPNGVHARGVTREVSRLMFRSGFKTIRLGLETIDSARQVGTGGKVDGEDVRLAIEYLRGAGFDRDAIGVYLMAGLPGQPWQEVEEGIERVWQWGAVPKIAEYSPIPGTALWEEAVRSSAYDIETEPLLQNNSILPCAWEGFSWDDLAALKKRLQQRIREKGRRMT